MAKKVPLTGLEPAIFGVEADVLSIRLRRLMIQQRKMALCYILFQIDIVQNFFR